MAIMGYPLTAPESGWQRIDSKDSRITYKGTWMYTNSFRYYDGRCEQTPEKEATASFNFTGTKIRLTGATVSSATTAVEVIIDGVSTTVSQVYQEYSGGNYQGLWFERLGLENREHAVTIKKTLDDSKYLYIDAVDIDEAGELKPYNPTPAPVIPAPTNLTAAAGDAKVTLNWNAVTGATGYNIKRSTAAGGLYTTIASNAPGTSYVDLLVTNGTIYYYVVTAITAAGESANSNEASAKPIAVPVENAQALLRVTMIDSSEREYKLPMSEITGFINWFTRTVGTGTTVYVLNKNMQSSKEYLAFDKIISFEVLELTK